MFIVDCVYACVGVVFDFLCVGLCGFEFTGSSFPFFLCICIHMSMYVCACVYIYIYIYECVCVCFLLDVFVSGICSLTKATSWKHIYNTYVRTK